MAARAKAGSIRPIRVDEPDCPEDSTHTNLTGEGCSYMHAAIVIPGLRSRLSPGDLEKCWYQQDGAAPRAVKIPG